MKRVGDNKKVKSKKKIRKVYLSYYHQKLVTLVVTNLINKRIYLSNFLNKKWSTLPKICLGKYLFGKLKKELLEP